MGIPRQSVALLFHIRRRPLISYARKAESFERNRQFSSAPRRDIQ
jgi:hypothetical protein